MKKLNFCVEETNNRLRIIIPNKRLHDIQQEIDIVEEIARIYGFNNYIDSTPTFSHRTVNNPTSQIIQKIRKILRLRGLHEVINYSFQYTTDNIQKDIINPLNKDLNILRDSLIKNLILLKQHNIYQNNGTFEIFEIGSVFLKDLSSKTYKESKHLCCLMGNNSFNQLNWKKDQNALSWFQAKGQIEDLLEKLDATVSWSMANNDNPCFNYIKSYIHPTKSIYIKYRAQTIGVFSELNYRMHKSITPNHRLYFCEIDIIKLSETINRNSYLKYKFLPYPNHPKTIRDLSIEVDKSISMKYIQDVICSIKVDEDYMIESIEVLNEYYHSKEGRTICFRINYRSLKKTLTNIEVDTLESKFQQKIKNILKSKT